MVRAELMRWAEAEVVGVPAECKFCKPQAIGSGTQASKVQSDVMSQYSPLSTQDSYRHG